MADDNPPAPGVTRERVLEVANEAMRGTLMERMGIEWLEVGTARLVARMPVEGNEQVYGLLHGGATAALCETVGSFGTAVVVGLDRRVAGIQITVNHLRAARRATSRASASHSGSDGTSPCGTSGSRATTTAWWPRPR